MNYLAGDEDTICALSTPEGQGGIAIIRISGKNAVTAARRLCDFLPASPESHRVYYGMVRSARDQSEIDEVLVTFFRSGRSFTGEDTVEISCHGSKYLTLTLLDELVNVGCRIARRGEFTYRGFMNGRIDLVQAEGVLGLIQSQTRLSNRAALNHLRGVLSKQYKEFEDQIMSVVCQLEAGIDFTHENLVIEDNAKLMDKLRVTQAKAKELLESYKVGRQMREGLRILITGAPNAGKSSLLNMLADEDRSIVTDIPGTTRDLVEFRTSAFGIEAVFVDSAGVRDSDDIVELAGIKKALKELQSSDYILFVVDLKKDIKHQLDSYKTISLSHKSLVVVGNKVDLLMSSERKKVSDQIREFFLDHQGHLAIEICSLKTGEGVSEVKNSIERMLQENKGIDGVVVTQSRHAELLKKLIDSLDAGIAGFMQNLSPELIIFELKEAIGAVHELLGISVDDRVLDRIFKEFCIGK